MRQKGYVSGWEKNPSDDRIVDFLFTSNPESALYHETREAAQIECRFLDSRGISIPSNEGGRYTLRGFQIEELKPDRFVCYCEGPFIAQRRGQCKATLEIHPGDVVMEIATKREGTIGTNITYEDELGKPPVPTQVPVRFPDGEVKTFRDLNQLRLIECPHQKDDDESGMSPLQPL
jgi:hypothetical protein